MSSSVSVPHSVITLCDEVRIYAVEVRLPGRSGVTLWGGNVGDGRDLFLVDGDGRVPLYSSAGRLAAGLTGAPAGPLARAEGYPELVDRLPGALGVSPADQEVAAFDYPAALLLLQAPDALKELDGGVVDCLDAALDLAHQVGDDAMVRALTDPAAPLAGLYGHLWGERPGGPSPDVASEFRHLVRWFEGWTRSA